MAIQNATGHTYKDKFNERIWSKVGVKNQFMVPLQAILMQLVVDW